MTTKSTPAMNLMIGIVSANALLCQAGCTKDELPLAPYAPGVITLSQLSIEDSVYTPRVSWSGGYVCAVGVNRGTLAILDTSLQWLIHQSGNGLHYQQRFGETPAGAENLTATYGGQPATSLVEDQVYTFWVARDDVWGILAANPGKVLRLDTAATVAARVVADTVFLAAASYSIKVNPINLWIGIRNVFPVGRLGVIDVKQTNTNNAPIISFRVTQTGVTPPDTLLADLGICSGGAYEAGSVVWEVLAVDSTVSPAQFWTRDVIASPVTAGQYIPGTYIFTPFPTTGLTRNKTYYVWIANKNWDQRNRLRSTYNYASATFETY
ncbi:MAG: hypothetical protein AB1428_13415 [Bacteroidota bacterium]